MEVAEEERKGEIEVQRTRCHVAVRGAIVIHSLSAILKTIGMFR